MIIFDKRNSANSLNIAKYSVTIVNDKISRFFFFLFIANFRHGCLMYNIITL